MKGLVSISRLLALCVVVSVVSGCATYRNAEPAPRFAAPLHVSYADDGLSGMTDLPLGVYRVPGGDVLITGHQTPSIGGLLFGPLGLLASDALDAAAAGKKTQEVQTALAIKLSSLAGPITQEQINTNGLATSFRLDEATGKAALRINSGLVLSFVSDTDVVPYVVLKPNLQDAQKFSLWGTRYIAAVGAPRPLVGQGGWVTDGGKPLREAVSTTLKRVINVMLTDIAKPYPRDEKSLIVVETGYPFARMRMQGFGFKLWEDEQSVGFVPKLGDAIVYTGVHILDKQATSARPAPADATPMLNMTPAQTQWPGQAAIASPKPFMAPPQPPAPPATATKP